MSLLNFGDYSGPQRYGVPDNEDNEPLDGVATTHNYQQCPQIPNPTGEMDSLHYPQGKVQEHGQGARQTHHLFANLQPFNRTWTSDSVQSSGRIDERTPGDSRLYDQIANSSFAMNPLPHNVGEFAPQGPHHAVCFMPLTNPARVGNQFYQPGMVQEQVFNNAVDNRIPTYFGPNLVNKLSLQQTKQTVSTHTNIPHQSGVSAPIQGWQDLPSGILPNPANLLPSLSELQGKNVYNDNVEESTFAPHHGNRKQFESRYLQELPASHQHLAAGGPVPGQTETGRNAPGNAQHVAVQGTKRKRQVDPKEEDDEGTPRYTNGVPKRLCTQNGSRASSSRQPRTCLANMPKDKIITRYENPLLPIPKWKTLAEICREYPNHLMYEGLDPFFQWFWSANNIWKEVPQDIRDEWKRMGVYKGSDGIGMLQNRRDDRLEELGPDAVTRLIRQEKLHPSPDNRYGRSDPLNLGLNPEAPKRPSKGTRETTKPRRSKKAATVEGAPLESISANNSNITRPESTTNTPLHPEAVLAQFHSEVCVLPVPGLPLGSFWGVPYWQSKAQLENFWQICRHGMNKCWVPAVRLADIDPSLIGVPASAYFDNILTSARWNRSLRIRFLDLYEIERRGIMQQGEPDPELHRDPEANRAFKRVFPRMFQDFVESLLQKASHRAMSKVLNRLRSFDAQNLEADFLAIVREMVVRAIPEKQNRVGDALTAQLRHTTDARPGKVDTGRKAGTSANLPGTASSRYKDAKDTNVRNPLEPLAPRIAQKRRIDGNDEGCVPKRARVESSTSTNVLAPYETIRQNQPTQAVLQWQQQMADFNGYGISTFQPLFIGQTPEAGSEQAPAILKNMTSPSSRQDDQSAPTQELGPSPKAVNSPEEETLYDDATLESFLKASGLSPETLVDFDADEFLKDQFAEEFSAQKTWPAIAAK
ncbi:hypothetical protein LTR07_008595 [Exophiala xenobiotica]|nr:hypothetical protein LTR79_006474 [Exophiala xenobiotica]KAK5409583.1 hypothetical protein LTR90_008772 [Exophiala xenobiotica]KAK5475025.1 hypothetical protein LTR26_009358 [Exophiala xenobiotica]KAK5486120.1 hypothetical protein LTR83_008263 [Exophiala xenobiotica]KAK5512566.1 hypothetical protein LTR07_008595 [Exophiala xenobiotica]